MNNEAKRFLDLISSSSAHWHFQTFSDDKSSKGGSTPQGPFDSMMSDQLDVFNKHGNGIFVAINQHSPNKPRRKNTTTVINAIFADFDDSDTALGQVSAMADLLMPTVTVESSPGKYHVYYALSRPDTIPLAGFPKWQRKIANDFGADKSITDTSRVMRLPGYVHQKSTPHLVRIVPEFTSGKRYGLDDLVSAFYGGRNNWLTSVAGSLKRNGMDPQSILTELHHYNEQLDSPLDEDEVYQIACGTDRYEADPEAAAEYAHKKFLDDLQLELDKNGSVRSSLNNLIKIMAHEDLVRYNKFANSIEIPEALWVRTTNLPYFNDGDESSLKAYVSMKYGTDFSRDSFAAAIHGSAMAHSYDPVADYLNSLVWDGTTRVSTSLSRFLGAPDSYYTSCAASCLFVGAVKRAFNTTGIRHDEMVVLVGAEGSGKSAFCRIIAKRDEWFTDNIGDLKSKDSSEGLQGKWIVEFAELKSMQGVSSEHTKAFLSRDVDKFRMPYGTRSSSFPRRCIIIGTTNNDKFLSDTGANRRFVPVITSGGYGSTHELDRKALAAEVDQLWAEAVHMYRAGHDGWMPKDVRAEAAAMKREFLDTGGLEQGIIEYLLDDLQGPRDMFIPRDFYFTLPGATPEKWDGGSKIFRQIMNACSRVFARPEFADWEEHYGRVNYVKLRYWRRIQK